MKTEDKDDWASRRHLHVLELMALTALGIYLCYRIALPFLPAMAWALALAVVFMPGHRWLLGRMKQSSLAASISVVAISLIVILPATFVGQRLISEAIAGAENVRVKIESGEWQRELDAHPRVAPMVRRVVERIDLPATVGTIGAWLTTATTSLVKGSVVHGIELLLTFYFLFFFLRDQPAALARLRSLSPLSTQQMTTLFNRVGDTVYATVYGTLAVAAIQGVLGGAMFWWLGLPAPLLWGMVMAALAIVPVLGAFVVWIPAALFLALDGSWGKAVILALWGGVVVGGIDNVLYPVLVGKRLKLHTIPTFIAIVGGLIVFGPSGLILGPVTLTVTMVLVEIWRSPTA